MTPKQTTVRLPEDLAEDAEAVARVRGTSVNQLIVDSLAAEIERVREDKDFTRRAKRLLERDKELLERLEFLWLAEQVTGIEATVLAKASRVDLADSALNAPAAGFGDEEFYPGLYDKAAVLCCRLSWNHPLPDGNKRAAWAALLMFVDLNGGIWDPDPPDVDEAEQAMLALAAGEVDEGWLADWLRERVRWGADEP
jgi:death-on-curing protein